MKLPILASIARSLAIFATPSAQNPAPRDPQSFTSTTTAILVDVVVRDRNGRPVVDLSADDFTLAEDGVTQKVDSFSRVTRGGGIGVNVAWRTPDPTTTVVSPGVPAPSSAASSAAPEEETTTAIVFGHLSSDSLGLAQRATLEYIPLSGESSAHVAVFAADPSIRAIQPYTTDLQLVRQAVARVIPSADVGRGAQYRADRRAS